MTLTGNILQITSKRDNRHKDIQLLVDKVEYITSRKDGHFFQDFAYEETLDTPLRLTGDCLARAEKKYTEPGEYIFQVYDKVGEEYVLDNRKQLVVYLEYIEEEDLHVLTSLSYSITVSNAEFDQIKKEKNREKGSGKRRDAKGRR